MSKDIKNKVIVITGGASGIGLEIALTFIQKGAKVVLLLDINEKLGTEAIKTINNKFGNNKAVFYKCDVATDIEAVWKKITDNYKTIDVLVNSAGVCYEKNVKKTIDVNVTALIDASLKFWQYNRTDKSGNGGTIINLASIYGYKPDQFVPVYQASKFAVMGFTRSLGHKYNFNRSGVRVVALCPGLTDTSLLRNFTIWDETILKAYCDFMKNDNPWQEVDAVANAAIEVFEKAESGTAWKIEGNAPIQEV